MAYRHGDAPVAGTPGPTDDVPDVDDDARPSRLTLNRLVRQGTDLLNEVHIAGVPPGMMDKRNTAESVADLEMYQRREREWTEAVEDVLANHPDLARFSLAQGLPASGYYAVENRVFARMKVLREIAADDPAECTRALAAAYQEGTRLRKRFVWRGGVPETSEAMKAVEAESWSEAATWAADTWQMLHRHYPGPYERTFFGDAENLSLGETGVRINASKERSDGSTTDDYMRRKLDVLSELLGKTTA